MKPLTAMEVKIKITYKRIAEVMSYSEIARTQRNITVIIF
jgi:hypothetical protein